MSGDKRGMSFIDITLQYRIGQWISRLYVYPHISVGDIHIYGKLTGLSFQSDSAQCLLSICLCSLSLITFTQSPSLAKQNLLYEYQIYPPSSAAFALIQARALSDLSYCSSLLLDVPTSSNRPLLPSLVLFWNWREFLECEYNYVAHVLNMNQ